MKEYSLIWPLENNLKLLLFFHPPTPSDQTVWPELMSSELIAVICKKGSAT